MIPGDQFREEEQWAASVIAEFVADSRLDRRVVDVATEATRMPVRLMARSKLLVLGSVAVLAVASIALVVVNMSHLSLTSGPSAVHGLKASSVVVNGATYDVSIGRGFVIPEVALTPWATDVQPNDGLVSGKTAYSVAGIDPRSLLVMPSAPGAADQAGPLPQYLLLVGSQSPSGPALCAYLDPKLDAASRTRAVPGC